MSPPIRYAVLGLGHFAQSSILPAFAAVPNSRLAAVVSSDPDKLATLSKAHGVPHAVGYDDIERLFQAGLVDAAYIATTSQLHAGLATRVARAGGHVLVETPMALNAEDAEGMARVCEASGTKLMVAYRLHFEAAQLAAIALARSGELGDLRSLNSTYCLQVRAPSSRTDPLLGGGPLHDLGIHCINTARCLFGSEAIEVTAFAERPPDDTRFDGVEAAVSVVLRFPEGRLATFTCAYDAVPHSRFELIGSRGRLIAEPAYDVDTPLHHELRLSDSVGNRSFSRSDQVAAVIEHFSQCIQGDVTPVPGADEGIADLRVIDAAFRSVRERRAIELERVPAVPRLAAHPARGMVPQAQAPLVHAQAPER
jgi:predicted dehydrogenase